jgi:cytochrome c biogenesis protein CcmG, thiol:disulfide interchange protein DsbE
MRPSDDLALPAAPASGINPSPPSVSGARGRRRLLFLIPLVGFVAIAAAFAVRLGIDPSLVPSPLIGRSVPEFSLPPVKGRQLGLATADLRGEVSFVNVFASWCVACREEHPLLMQLAQTGTLPVHGLNYKDRPDDAARWLNTMGDPYTRTGADLDGRVGIDWGVYGVPETFLVDAEGRIAFKQIGPVTPEILDRTILPLVRKLQRKGLRTP